MSNVVQLRKPKVVPATVERPEVDVTGLILAISNWAEDEGIDVYNDTKFHVRVGDLMAHLQIMAKESRKAA